MSTTASPITRAAPLDQDLPATTSAESPASYMPSFQELLLREWTPTTNEDTMPPVAPAVVLNETSEGSNYTPRVYSYPVATFVSNFVRTSVNELRDHISIYAATVEEPEGTVRTEPPSEVPRERLMSEEDGNAEYVLIDGDLVAIPAIHERYMDEYDHARRRPLRRRRSRPSSSPELEENEDFEPSRTSLSESSIRCRSNPSRMHRGMRKVKKWIKRKNLIPRKVRAPQETPQPAAPETSNQETVEVETVMNEGSRSPARKLSKRKKNRLPWLRDIESHPREQPFTDRSLASATSAMMPPAVASPPRHQDSVSAASLLTIEPPTAASLHHRAASNTIAQADASILTLDVTSPSFNRQASIAAEYVGYVNDDQYLNVLPEHILAAEAYIEDRLDDYDKYDKKDECFPRSLVPRDADFKVDKQEAPCVDAMLRRAGEFAEEWQDDEPLLPSASLPVKGKSDGESVPLSMATVRDTVVHNDILKLVMVGDALVDKTALARSLRQSNKKPRKKRTTLGVDVHTWTPPNPDNVTFTMWDVQGASMDATHYDANFGAHPGTQSLFFSDRALYLLVWDLAANNRKTYRREIRVAELKEDEEEDEADENEYLREEANRQADRALQADLEERVLSWVDCIARRGPHSAILPVALVTGDMSPVEAKRRCDSMQTVMMQYTERMENAPKVLSGAETVLCVSLETNMGMDLLQRTIVAIAMDASHSVFDHVGTPVPHGTTMVLETIRRLKRDHKLVLVNHLLAELALLKGETGVVLLVEEVMEALHFLSSIGEVLYFGSLDDVLSHYVILSRKWLVSALSCILRNDLKRELVETRRFMNMQCLYSDQQFPENLVTQTFSTGASNCPLLSSSDTQMLWQSMSFMREAADMSSQSQENATTSSTMFGFLEHLLVHTGVFLPLDVDRFASPDAVYFVPSLLAQSSTRDVWTYKSSEAWMTTLAHSWLFRDGAPYGLMEHVTVSLLRDLYEFSHIVAAMPRSPPPRSQTFPFAQTTLTDFLDNHDGEAIGHIKIHQMMCWKNSLLVKIGCIFSDGNEFRESFVEILVTIADPSSQHCVSSDAMRSNMHRLIISGKGQAGHHGRKLWRGGYKIVLDSIKASVAVYTNVDVQVVCPECLARSHPSSASTWSWDSVRAAAETGASNVRCMRGHRVDSNLICGTIKAAGPKPDGGHSVSESPKKSVKDLLPAVVLVALWDPKTVSVRNIGSGFIVDRKQGLIVTAGHILFDMEEGRTFGTPYFGLKNAKVLIGFIPEENAGRKKNTASFRYFAKIVADDIHSMDACVLKITTRFENDLDDESLVGQEPEKVIDVQDEQLPTLKITKRFELEEGIRILGFNQAGEGWLEQGKHVNRSADFAKGYICKEFTPDDPISESESDDSSSSGAAFVPREELVVMCPTLPGHSGGPCVNDEGRVVGILSRADPVDRQRCYLVPSTELKLLVNKAKKSTSRVAGLKDSY